MIRFKTDFTYVTDKVYCQCKIFGSEKYPAECHKVKRKDYRDDVPYYSARSFFIFFIARYKLTPKPVYRKGYAMQRTPNDVT